MFLSSCLCRGPFESALQGEILERNCILPDAIKGVDVVDFELEQRALRHDDLRIRLCHVPVFVQIKLIGSTGAGQQSGAIAIGFFFGGKVVLRQGLGPLAQR